jgi:hypothetical protein
MQKEMAMVMVMANLKVKENKVEVSINGLMR